MKRCPNCGERRLETLERTEAIDVAGHVFKGKVPGWSCPACGEVFLPAGELAQLELRAATELARAGERSGEALRFMRKTVGLKAAEFANLIDVAPETVSRWETEKWPVERRALALLTALVLDASEGRRTTLDRLHALEKPRRLAKTVRLAPA